MFRLSANIVSESLELPILAASLCPAMMRMKSASFAISLWRTISDGPKPSFVLSNATHPPLRP